jgi:hypothetical protein
MIHTATIQKTDSDDPKQGKDGAYKFQISVNGVHNVNQQSLKNEDLPFAVSLTHSPMVNGVGKTPRYLPGSTVYCMPIDANKQQWIILGSSGASGKDTSGSQLESSSYDNTKRDTPWHDGEPSNKNPKMIKGGVALNVANLDEKKQVEIDNQV